MRYAQGRGRHEGSPRPRRKIKRERMRGRGESGMRIGEMKRKGERDTEKAVALDH